MTSDDPFEAFKASIAGTKAAPPRRQIPTVEQAQATSEALFDKTIAATRRFDALAKEQAAEFSVAWRREKPRPNPGFDPIIPATIVARRGGGAKPLELAVQMQDQRLWVEDSTIKEASSTPNGAWTAGEQDALISAIGTRLSAYFKE